MSTNCFHYNFFCKLSALVLSPSFFNLFSHLTWSHHRICLLFIFSKIFSFSCYLLTMFVKEDLNTIHLLWFILCEAFIKSQQSRYNYTKLQINMNANFFIILQKKLFSFAVYVFCLFFVSYEKTQAKHHHQLRKVYHGSLESCFQAQSISLLKVWIVFVLLRLRGKWKECYAGSKSVCWRKRND